VYERVGREGRLLGAPPHSLDSIADAVRKAGGVFNPEREAITRVLLGRDEPLDVDEVWTESRRSIARLSRSTVNRVLSRFRDMGVVEVSVRTRGRQLYRLKRRHPSIYLICAKSGQAREVRDDRLLEALKAAARNGGYRLSGAVELRVAELPARPEKAVQRSDESEI